MQAAQHSAQDTIKICLPCYIQVLQETLCAKEANIVFKHKLTVEASLHVRLLPELMLGGLLLPSQHVRARTQLARQGMKRTTASYKAKQWHQYWSAHLQGDVHDRFRELLFFEVTTRLVGQREAVAGLVKAPSLGALCLTHKNLHIIMMRRQALHKHGHNAAA